MSARIVATGVVAPHAIGAKAFHARLVSPPSGDCVVSEFGDGADPSAHRLGRLDRMALAAAKQVAANSMLEDTALIFATGFGELTATESFLDSIFARGPAFGSPRDFSQSVHHATAGQLSIALRLRGLSLTVSGREVSGESALQVALSLLETGRASQVLVVAADEVTPALRAAYSAFKVLAPTGEPITPGKRGVQLGEGAAAVLLAADGPKHAASPRLTGAATTSHPVSGLRFPSTVEALRPLLDTALRDEPSPTVFAAGSGVDFDTAEAEVLRILSPRADVIYPSRHLGLHPGSGIFKLALAVEHLRSPGTAICHGVAQGGQQTVFKVVRD